MTRQIRNRRDFLKFVAASPCVALTGQTLADPKDALNVMDFEDAARRKVPLAHFAYMQTGVDDDLTLKANREAFQKIELRPRRLVDITHTDLKTELFGATWATPIFICPAGSQKAFHPDGEVATARAAKSKRTLQILSTVTSTPVEEVSKALGTPPWFQLYAPSTWQATEKLVRRAEAADCPALVLTVDVNAGRNTETLSRLRRADTRDCSMCHDPQPGVMRSGWPMFQGIDMRGVSLTNPAMDWGFVDRLKKLTRMKLLLKGIETREDARLCVDHGVDGIVVSNHGGRATETGRATIEALPEVVNEVGGRIPVLVDGGFRRGTDVFKALALGASAVGIGRPYLWGLGAFGQPGVERVLDILHTELRLVMRQCGARSVAEIGRAFVAVRS